MSSNCSSDTHIIKLHQLFQPFKCPQKIFSEQKIPPLEIPVQTVAGVEPGDGAAGGVAT